MKNGDLFIFITGTLTMLFIVIIARVIKDILSKGKHVPKPILVISIIGLMMICGLVSGIASNESISIILILTFGLGISGLIASLLIMRVVYKKD